jgi:serine/threonine-protein kinase
MGADRYRVIEELGGGGMGRVRLAADADGHMVVLKTAIHEDDDERLRDEARVGLRLRHPGLVETIELFEVADRSGTLRPVLVTAYVKSVSLLEMRRLGPLPPAVVCRLGKELALALDALHRVVDDDGRPLGVIHRDVTAANCLVGHDGRARLIDLGIARSRENRALRTETGLLRGTLRYLAPELFDGGSYAPQSDVWSLGVCLWEALMGRPAIVGSDAVAVQRISAGLVMICDTHEAPDPVAARAIRRLLEKDPLQRPATAKEAAAVLTMAEHTLSDNRPGDVDEVVRAVVGRAMAGLPLTSAGPTAAELRLSARTEVLVETSTVTMTVALPARKMTSTDMAAVGLQDYATALSLMERAHERAWQAQQERLAAATQVRAATPPAMTGATVVLERPTFPLQEREADKARRS